MITIDFVIKFHSPKIFSFSVELKLSGVRVTEVFRNSYKDKTSVLRKLIVSWLIGYPEEQ